MKNENQLEQLIEKSKQVGALSERLRLIKVLTDYFELAQLPGLEENPEWDNGFQAAIALIKGQK